MKIHKDSVVTYHFVLKDEQGTVLDTSGETPASYVHGYQNIFPLIEAALESKSAGDKVVVLLSAAQGFGTHDPKLVRVVPKHLFPQADQLKVGMKVYSDTDPDFVLKVLEITPETIKVDANHPLVDQNVVFEIEVVDVREA